MTYHLKLYNVFQESNLKFDFDYKLISWVVAHLFPRSQTSAEKGDSDLFICFKRVNSKQLWDRERYIYSGRRGLKEKYWNATWNRIISKIFQPELGFRSPRSISTRLSRCTRSPRRFSILGSMGSQCSLPSIACSLFSFKRICCLCAEVETTTATMSRTKPFSIQSLRNPSRLVAKCYTLASWVRELYTSPSTPTTNSKRWRAWTKIGTPTPVCTAATANRRASWF